MQPAGFRRLISRTGESEVAGSPVSVLEREHVWDELLFLTIKHCTALF
jgi:hypothetical protein